MTKEEFEKRRDAFLAELTVLSKKYDLYLYGFDDGLHIHSTENVHSEHYGDCYEHDELIGVSDKKYIPESEME